MDALAIAGGTAIRRGSRSFALASRLFAPGTRESAWLLYAWCRHCDDVVDGQQWGHGTAPMSQAEAAARLGRLYTETRDALAGRAGGGSAFAGLQRVVHAHHIPHRLPLALLDGFAMDVEGRPYETFDETLHYCYHVAGVVGIMLAMVMGAHDEEVLDRACDLGIAFQLTNIARDLVDDAAIGRVYVPAIWLREAGVPAGEVAEARHRPARSGIARRLVAAAEPYYASARAGIGPLPWRSAWAVATALGVYRAIGRQVVQRGEQAWDERVVVSTGRKLAHVAAGLAIALQSRATPDAPPRESLWHRPRSLGGCP